jgi:hypothetical protein
MFMEPGTELMLKFKSSLQNRPHGPEREQKYSSTLSLTSALAEWVVNAVPRPLYPR